jgi:peptide/nickel transport system permease protein
MSALLLAMVGGVFLGLIGANSGRIMETLTMRLVDMMLCVPPIFLAIAIIAFVGASLTNLILIMGLLYMPQFARLSYTSCLSVKENEYVEAAKAVGCTNFRIIYRYILPNIISPIIIQASFSLGALILLESGLSFLGLGVMPPTPSWGVMLGTAKSYLYVNGMLLFWPALAIAVVVLTINIVGDGVRDALDPRAGKLAK